MRNVLGVVLLAAASILWYRSSSRVGHETRKLVIPDEEVFPRGISRNCTFTSCYDPSLCVLNSTHVTFYLQPIVEIVDRNGTVVSPAPSREFLELREYLRPFSVPDATAACLSLPGVDFFNFDRFRSEQDVLKTVSLLKSRLPNMVIFNLLGKVPLLDVVLISSFLGRDTFRPRFDLSVPLILPATGESVEVEKTDLLLIPLINVTGSQKQEVLKELGETKATFVGECPTNPRRICLERGKEVELEQLVKSHKFVLLLDSSPTFPRLLTLSLKHQSVPILYGDELILPFQETIDWSSYTIQPSSLPRIPHILGRLTVEEIETRRREATDLYRRAFASIGGLTSMVVKELELRILPSPEDARGQCPALLPHLVHSTTTCAFLVGEDDEAVHTTDKLCSSNIHEIVLFWTSEEDPPLIDWKCPGKHPEVVYGAAGLSPVAEVARRKATCSSVLFLPHGSCPFRKSVLKEAMDMWISVPHALVHLPQTTTSCQPATLLNTIYLSHCFSETELYQLSRTGRVASIPSVYLAEPTSPEPTPRDSAIVLL